MRLKLYRAATMAEAMAQLRDELGPEALILATKRVTGGIELTAGLDQPDDPPVAALPPRAPHPAWPAAHATQGGLDMQYHAIPAGLAQRLAGDDLPQRLRALFRFAPLALSPLPTVPGQPGHAPLLFAGTPGAGKTLSVARLATRLVLSGQHPVVITADGRRAGGAEELAAYTRLLGLTLLAASTPATLTRALAQAQAQAQAQAKNHPPVLIDTAGINPFEPAETEALAALIAASGATAVLVIQAGAHPEEAGEQAAAFAALGVARLLPTRLDIARRLGSVLAAADPSGAGLALTEAGIGTGATDGLAQITPEFLADRLLRAQPRPAAPALPPPVFPPARARAADAWMPSHG